MTADTDRPRSLITHYVKWVLLIWLSSYITNWCYDHCESLIDAHRNQSVSARADDKVSINVDGNWEDEAAIAAALNRSGLGEVGAVSSVEEERLRLYIEFGFDAMLSDYISLNRSVPDKRHAECRDKKYLADLPRVSIIIIFHNEHHSVLLRTVYGIVQRTPPQLLNEILLVDDCSTLESLQAPLEDHLRLHLPPPKVRLLRMPQRKGLMGARMHGARAALNSSEVLIFLDSHFEVMYNWLPPLLEPIALNPRACTSPIIDTIAYDTFEYKFNAGYRGYFNWGFGYEARGLSEEESSKPTVPYRNNVMLGGALAIGRDFFWDLGGYDEGMEFWGGEQYEMSFKIWMCGGELLDVACSRMGHLYRDHHSMGNTNLYGDYRFVFRNFRRVADVWMDEQHRKYLFDNSPNVAAVTDEELGDLSDRHAIRERLQCKSFKWLMDNIYDDLIKYFPPYVPEDFAYGVLSNVGATNLCIEGMERDTQGVILAPCAEDRNQPQLNQSYRYTWRKELRDGRQKCLESYFQDGLVKQWSCHSGGGNQEWYYDRQTKWIVAGGDWCILANEPNRTLHLKKCEVDNPFMQWDFFYVRDHLLLELEEKMKVNKIT